MIRPESDWSGENEQMVVDFMIGNRFSVRGATIDIRRFEWVGTTPGALCPERHYVDFSLNNDVRRSVLRADAWSEPRRSGSAVYLPPGYSYWGEPAQQKRHLLCLAFDDDFLGGLFGDERVLQGALPSADLQGAMLRRYAQGIAAELADPGFASPTMLESMLLATVIELARHVRQSDPEQIVTAGPSDRQARRIADYVTANLSGTLSVAEIARECGMSTRHVARVFKEATGLGLGEFVARSRIRLAKDMLAGDEFRVKEISWRCGFRSTSAFSAAFRAATNMTPREYRRNPASLQ